MFLPTRYYQPTAALGGVRAFHPTQLPGLVALYDISDLSSLFEERTGASASTPASVDGVVGTVLDLSGQGNHWVAPSDAGRPILRQSGSLFRLAFDGVDDGMHTLDFSGDTNGNHLFHSLRLDPDDTNGQILVGDDERYIGRYASGVSSIMLNSSSGSPSYFVNDEQFTGTTRDDLYDFLRAGEAVLAEARGFDRGAWGGEVWFSADEDSSGGYRLVQADLFATAIFSSVLAGSDLQKMQQWMAGKGGITL